MKKRLILLFTLFLCVFAYAASAQITQYANRLNYFESQTHVVNITNSAGIPINFTIPIPGDWTFVSGGGCASASGFITCTIPASGSGFYTVTSPTVDNEYNTTIFAPIMNPGNSSTNVTFLKINDNELFHTLVEFGRGRGNYFYDSGYGNLSGSGHDGIGCPYLPNGTLFELNFLHKVLNVKQYFDLATATAYNATFSCTYPNGTVVRTHLVTDINFDPALGTNASYFISEIEGSWERMGYLGQNYDDGEYLTGSQLVINCTDITYALPDAGGNLTFSHDDIVFEIRNREPFTVVAEGISGQIKNGTSEYIVRYNITNSEVYPVTNVIAEIIAPLGGSFIGTRSELWGSSLERFRLERIDWAPGETESIDLVVRFNTTATPFTDGEQVNLSEGVDISYITCWEANAYNPLEYTQNIPRSAVGNASFNATEISEIPNLQDQLNLIINLTNQINITIVDIQNTVNNIEELLNNFTSGGNITAQDIIDAINNISNNNNQILDELQQIQDFDEELVFLVTDAFGLQQSARDAAESGNLDESMQNLQEANQRLNIAAQRLTQLQTQAESQQPTLFITDNRWLLPVALVVLAVGLYLYLFAEVPQRKGPPPKKRHRRP